MDSLNFKDIKLECSKHGDAPWMQLTFKGVTQFLCAVCMVEVLTRMGVHGMFPVAAKVEDSDAIEWPEHLEG